MISVHDAGPGDAGGDLAAFRQAFYGCLTARRDALFELADAVLCADGPVCSLVGLSLTVEHRRGHGALYDAVNAGAIAVSRLRQALAGVDLPRQPDGQLMLAVDVSAWLRPNADTAPDRAHCHVRGRGHGEKNQTAPGWPYSFVVALEPGRHSWVAVLDVLRLAPLDDVTAVTATQVRDLVERLRDGGRWQPGDPPILVLFDAGYDLTRLTWLLTGLPVIVIGRLRSDRVFYGPTPPPTGTRGRPARHGPVLDLDQPATHPEPHLRTTTQSRHYGTVDAAAFDRMHQRLKRRDAWAGHPDELPVVEGTLIQVTIERIRGIDHPKPMWLWASETGLHATTMDRYRQAYRRRFDIEHLFRFCKQTLGWTKARLRDPAAADRWTWLIIAAYTQLRLARHHTTDLRRPWERPSTRPGRLSPTRVRRGFRYLRTKLPQPARAPKTSHPGPGRPPGSRNKHPAPRHPAGKRPQPETKG